MNFDIASIIISSVKKLIDYEKHFNNEEIKTINEVCNKYELLNSITLDANFGYSKDPALKCISHTRFKKGILGLALYRISNNLIYIGEDNIAFQLHLLSCIKLSMDIDPRCRIDAGVYIDHGTGIVIGETAHINSGVLIFHGVTLGSRKLSHDKGEKRHPTIGKNSTIGCYSMILGSVHIGDDSKVAAGSVVTKDIPKNTLFINNRN